MLANKKDHSSDDYDSRDENDSIVCRHIRLYRIINEVIINKIEVALIEGRM